MRYTIFYILMCCYGTLSAQQPAAQKLKLFFEKVYLHTDREQYTAGEDIWFKAYLVDAQGAQQLWSNNLYAELIGPDNKIAERKAIRLEKGLGNGDFKLADSIAPGIYRLRAYTNWMRNFGDNFIFEKTVQIFSNALPLTLGTVQPKVPAPKIPVTARPPVTTAQSPALQKNVITFFPEGGSMVEGVAGFVAFRIEDAFGKGIAASGTVSDGLGGQPVGFESNTSGMGMMLFTPAAGRQYTAKGTDSNGRLFSAALPMALQQGFVMNVRNADSIVRIGISTNAATFEKYNGQQLQLVLKSKGKTYQTASVKLTDLQAGLTLQKNDFPRGISSITLSEQLGKPLCERLFYHEGADRAVLSISADKPSYGPKGKTTVTIKATDGEGKPLKADLSLAVTDAGIVAANSTDIVSYLNLRSEVKGNIENPAQFFDENNPRRKQQLDLLLLTQGWRDFTWKRLADSALRITYAPEQWITVSGRVRESGRDVPVQGANITLSALGAKGTKLFSSRTDTAGRYYFDDIGLYGPQTIRLTSKDDKGQKKGRILLDSLWSLPAPVTKLPERVIENAASAQPIAEKLLNRKEAERKYTLSDTIGLKEVTVTASRNVKLFGENLLSFGYPDEVYNITDKDKAYRDVFHYLQQNSKAIVGDVYIWLSQYGNPLGSDTTPPPPTSPPSPAYLYPPNPPAPYDIYKLLYYPGPRNTLVFPRIIVDGLQKTFSDRIRDLPIMADAQQTYFSLPMDKVKKVVIRHLLGKDESLTQATDVYLVYLTLKEGAMDRAEPDVVRADVNGYYQARTFYSPKYDVPSTRPDLRTTIYWEPNIATNEKGEATVIYYNAGPITKVRIVAEGITATGQPVVGTATYEVK